MVHGRPRQQQNEHLPFPTPSGCFGTFPKHTTTYAVLVIYVITILVLNIGSISIAHKIFAHLLQENVK